MPSVPTIWILNNILTLAELEALTSTWTTRFLSLDNSCITLEEAFLLEGNTVLRVDLNKSSCNTESYSLCLTLKATATNVGLNIVVGLSTELLKCLNNYLLELRNSKILLVVLTVDLDIAVTLCEVDTGYGSLTSAYCVCNFCHDYLRSFKLISLGC